MDSMAHWLVGSNSKGHSDGHGLPLLDGWRARDSYAVFSILSRSDRSGMVGTYLQCNHHYPPYFGVSRHGRLCSCGQVQDSEVSRRYGCSNRDCDHCGGLDFGDLSDVDFAMDGAVVTIYDWDIHHILAWAQDAGG